jgi:hypothetical protein
MHLGNAFFTLPALFGQLADAYTSYLCYSKGAAEGNSILSKWSQFPMYTLKVILGLLPVPFLISGNLYAIVAGLALAGAATVIGLYQADKNYELYRSLK